MAADGRLPRGNDGRTGEIMKAPGRIRVRVRVSGSGFVLL